jgi:pimeloyl-ACP methyl ester carboxylesterase
MFKERAFIAQVEAASTEELAQLLLRPTLEQEKALRSHLGDDRYQRMHGMALRRNVTRGLTKPKGNVVVIHGIMGAELSVSSGGSGDLTWVNAFRVMRGWLDRLRLDPTGRREANEKFKVTASGIMKRHYGEMLLSLSEHWNVQAFWFDWRKDLNLAADALNTRINEWFGNDAPVHIVAHSMGGLAARTLIANYPNRWRSMLDQKSGGILGGRLVMLGTPNYGSFAIPQVITGLEGLVRKLALLDVRHSVGELLETLNTFVGSFQMLPSPDVIPSALQLYTAGTYSPFKVTVSQQHLDNARVHHQKLAAAIDTDRMIYVAGYDQPTFSDIADYSKLNSLDGYKVTMNGDGRVTHELGLLKGVPSYYIKESHGDLSSNAVILRALEELLATGRTSALSQQLPSVRATTAAVNQKSMKDKLKAEQERDEEQIQISLTRMRGRGMPRAMQGDENGSAEPAAEEASPDEFFSPEQRRLEESITSGFLGRGMTSDERDEVVEEFEQDIEAVELEIGIALGGIDSINYDGIRTSGKENAPVDSVAVGHYIGVQPQAAELALDRSISAALMGKTHDEAKSLQKSRLVLTQYTERGTIHGKLGEPFIIPDPRYKAGPRGPEGGRIVILAGMGEAGSFGAPELTVLARELCWALGRLKKQHLATVMIGSGNGNLSVREAAAAWMNGVRRALGNSTEDKGRRLLRITFVEFDPRKVRNLQNALLEEGRQQSKFGMTVIVKALSDAELEEVEKQKESWDKADWDRYKSGLDNRRETDADAAPTRVNLSLDASKKTYTFGAITETAAVPERDIRIDPKLVMQANDEMVGENVPAMQLERGRFLEGLLIPNDLRRQLYSRAPLVLMLDSTTARIHWEMVAQPELTAETGATAHGGESSINDLYKEGFLGTTRGLTRQLRTTFAPPPEPPPPPRRVLRVLVVADPAADAHLPGAQEEGVAIADLFESYNVAHQDNPEGSRIQVKRMFGPREATRTNVLREIMSRPYDVLHYAGHCVFAWGGDPEASGWVFNAANRELLSAFELNRIDRVPKFVFSNACESGITPDRSEERNAYLAPSFAEAFFNRGVSNFVCTAWPVDDIGARQFALKLYSKLLGLREIEGQPGQYEIDPAGSRPMHISMRDARTCIADTTNGRTTWGAYQHYGSPYFQFFYPNEQEETRRAPAASKAGASKAKSKAATAKPRGGRRAAKK